MRKLKNILLITGTAAILITAAFLAVSHYYPVKYSALIDELSGKYGIDRVLVYSLIHTESKFDENAESKAGAKGLMQLMEDTADWAAGEIGITDYDTLRIFEPGINIEIGCWYLNTLNRKYDGDLTLMLAAYNAGGGRVAEWLSDPEHSSDGVTLDSVPYAETRGHIKKTTDNMKVYRILLEIDDRVKGRK